MNLKLFILTLNDENDPEGTVNFTVLAASENEARELAFEFDSKNAPCPTSLKEIWMNSKYSSCKEIEITGNSRVILAQEGPEVTTLPDTI